MIYKTKTIALNTLKITPLGIVRGMCEKCTVPDCENPVEYRLISMFGINEKMRVYISNGEPQLVIDCDSVQR
jgi:hypothetical protein